MVKGQDMVVLAALMKPDSNAETYAQLANSAKLSVSEAHSAVKRLRNAALVDQNNRVIKQNAEEFLIHGLRYVFPPSISSSRVSGIPASFAAPIAADEFAVSGDILVWPYSRGTAVGKALLPLYATAPEAAADNKDIYDRLAVMDMLRAGRLRERAFAERLLKELL